MAMILLASSIANLHDPSRWWW